MREQHSNREQRSKHDSNGTHKKCQLMQSLYVAHHKRILFTLRNPHISYPSMFDKEVIGKYSYAREEYQYKHYV